MVTVDDADGFELSPLEHNAQERRKRLQELRERALARKSGAADAQKDESPLLLLNPRAYKTATAGFSNVGEEVKSIMQKTDAQVEDIIEDAKNIQLGEELDISVLAPKKVDWDLKRGIQDKLDKLERHTRRAITDLVRERLQKEKGDLASGVNDLQRHARLD